MGSRRLGVRRMEALIDDLLASTTVNGVNGSQFVLDDPDRFCLYEDFSRRPGLNGSLAAAFNLDFELLGTGAANNDVSYSSTTAGITLRTDTDSPAAGQAAIIAPHLDTDQTAWTGCKWGTENQVQWECLIRTDASIADMGFWAGLKLTNTNAYATDDHQVYFMYQSDDNGGALTTNENLHLIYSIGGTDYITDLGIAVAANTSYRLAITIDSERRVNAWVDGVQYNLVQSSTAGGATVSPQKGAVRSLALANDEDLIPYIGVTTRTTASKKLTVVQERINRIVFE